MHIESGSYTVPENVDPVACQLHLLTLLMEVRFTSYWTACLYCSFFCATLSIHPSIS